jgi:protocatechuate 3,4-dioxygenase beta subunit
MFAIALVARSGENVMRIVAKHKRDSSARSCMFAATAIGLWLLGGQLMSSVAEEPAASIPGIDDVADTRPEPYVVSGRVTSVDGQAIPGATIEWGRIDTRFNRRLWVQTAADGTYSLSLKSLDRGCQLAASAPGFATYTGNSQLKRGQQVRDFVLVPLPKEGDVVAGTVVDENNRPIAGAAVEAFTPIVGFNSSFSMATGRDYFPGPDRVATTDDAGQFRIVDLPTDEVQLSVSAKHRHVNDENYPVEEGLVIQMSGSGQAGVVQCRIVDASTKLPPENIDDVRIVPRYTTTAYKCAAEDGTFRWPREVILGERYVTYVYAKGYAAAEAKLTAVPAQSKEFASIELKPRPALRGKLIDAETGQPVGGAPLIYGIADRLSYIEWSSLDKYADGHHSLSYVQHVTPSPTGEFWFAEPESGPRGLIIVFVAGYQRLLLYPRDRRWDEATGELLIKLKRESAVEGIVLRNGKPAADETVSVSGSDPQGFHNMYESVRTDSNGRYRYGRLAPGHYRVRGDKFSRVAKVERGETVIVNLGDNLGPISIHGRAAPGVSISFSPLFKWDYSRFSTSANDQGQYEMSGLKAGRYAVSLSNSYSTGYISHEDREIVVKDEGQQIDFLPKPKPGRAAKKAPKTESKK